MPKETDQAEKVYRDAATELPPEALDRAISAAARSALIPWYRRRGSLTGLSTAAAVLIAAGLVSIQFLLDEPPASTPAQSVSAAAQRKSASESEPRGERIAADSAFSGTESESERTNTVSSPTPAPLDLSDQNPPAQAWADRDASTHPSTQSLLTAKPHAVRDLRQRAAAGADAIIDSGADALDRTAAEKASPTCLLPPDLEGKPHELQKNIDGSMHLLTGSGEWQCLDGKWVPVDDRDPSADALSEEQQ